MISFLPQTVNPSNKFSNKVISLLNEYKNVDVKAIGFLRIRKMSHMIDEKNS